MPPVIRVLHLRDTTFLCGPGKTILETIKLNPDTDVQYEVAAFGKLGSNPYLQMVSDHCHAFGLPESRIRLPKTALELARYVKKRKVSIIHSHDFKTRALAFLVRWLTGVPHVTTLHGYIDVSLKSRSYNQLDRRILRSIELVFVVSRAMVKDIARLGISAERIRLVRNCIVLEHYPFGVKSKTVRRELSLTDTCPLIGHIGRLSPEKGQRDLLEAYPEIVKRIPEARLVFAGSGLDLDYLQTSAARLDINNSVFFLGFRPDIKQVITNLDLLVLNSQTEGLPNVVLEAMALGVPVVATAVGGTPELVKSDVTGLLIPPSNSVELVKAVVTGLVERTRTSRWVNAARRWAEQEFDMKELIQRTHTIYRELE